MPYKSAKQAAYMHINHPEIAKDWDEKYEEVKASPKKPVRRRQPRPKDGRKPKY